jgi:hypothetical protein
MNIDECQRVSETECEGEGTNRIGQLTLVFLRERALTNNQPNLPSSVLRFIQVKIAIQVVNRHI